MWQRWNSSSKIFEKSSDNGGSWTPLGLDAAIITQGTFEDARLSSNIPRKDGANIFTQTQRVSSIGPVFELQETDAPANAKIWRWAVNDQIARLDCVNDAYDTIQVNAMTYNRLGDVTIGRDIIVTRNAAVTGLITANNLVSANFNPTMTTDAGGSPAAYTLQQAFVARAGNQITVTGRVVLNGKGSLVATGKLLLGGFPFVNSGAFTAGPNIGYYQGLLITPSCLTSYINPGGNNAYIMFIAGAGGSGVNYLLANQVSDSFDIMFSGTYII